MDTRPNIILFNPDEFRADGLRHLGNDAAVSPNIDAIIRVDGVSFGNAYCQNPVCTPSRCSFMSGWYPHVRGHRSMHYMMQEDEPVLLRILKENGYYVWWGGKNDLIPGDAQFEKYCNTRYIPEKLSPQDVLKDKAWEKSWRGQKGGNNYYSFFAGKSNIDDSYFVGADWDFINAAVDFINNKPTDKPFCIYLPLLYPHPPYAVEEPWFSMIDRNKLKDRIPTPKDWYGKAKILKEIYNKQNLSGWNEEKFDELRATYYGMCARVDFQFGQIINALKKQGLYDNTAIFMFSDHGDYAGDYGLVEKNQNTFEDCLTKVPLIIKPPASFNVKARVTYGLTELIDILPTVADYAGIKIDHTHFGRSLADIVAGETEQNRNEVFCEGGRLPGETQCMELGHNEDSLYWPRLSIQASNGTEHLKAVMIRTDKYKYVKRLYEKDEFYDLEIDPFELVNRIENNYYSDIINQLKEKLLDFYIETADYVPLKADKR